MFSVFAINAILFVKIFFFSYFSLASQHFHEKRGLEVQVNKHIQINYHFDAVCFPIYSMMQILIKLKKKNSLTPRRRFLPFNDSYILKLNRKLNNKLNKQNTPANCLSWFHMTSLRTASGKTETKPHYWGVFKSK